MGSLSLRLESRRLLPGYAAGLKQRTALVEIAVEGSADAAACARIRAGVLALYPEQQLFGVAESHWPAAFLVDANSDVDDPLRALGDWVVAVTIAVQRWAREPVWRGQVVGADHRGLRIALPWYREAVFLEAVPIALRLVELWADPTPDPAELDRTVATFRTGLEEVQAQGLYPSTLRFVQAALERGIPFEVLPTCVQLGWGAGLERIDSSFTSHTSFIATATARNKFKATRTLGASGVPVPAAQAVAEFDAASRVAADLGWPVVIKPGDQDQGVGVVPGITNVVALRQAFDAAARLSPGNVIVEDHVEGDDHRLLVVRGQMIAAARRIRGGVTGDGVHTVEQLLDLVNSDPRRGANPRSMLRRLVLDGEALDCLAVQAVRIDSVPEPGRFVYLRRTANISTGGVSEDVTERVHPDNVLLAQRAARIVGLDIAGIDFLTTDITRSWREVGGAVCEVNAQPGLRPHWIGDPDRDVNGDILDIVLAGRSPRIPTSVITGAVDAAATATLLHRMWLAAGRLAGVCCSAGILIGDELITAEPVSPVAAFRMMIVDPAVEAAVIEVTDRQLGDEGHPCDRYDVAAVLGPGGDPAVTAEVVARATRAVVVDGDDPFCVAALPSAAAGRSILVTLDPESAALHRRNGADTVFPVQREGGSWIVLSGDGGETPVVALTDEPLRPVLFAVGLAWAHGLAAETISEALQPRIGVSGWRSG